jgi:hypothetical protein
MAKAVIIVLDDTIPDTEQDKKVTLDIEGHPYTGKVSTIITYTPVPVSSVVTLSAPGLQVISKAPI